MYSDSVNPVFLGTSPAIRSIQRGLPHLARGTLPVLISGEQGTGKTQLARLLAALSAGEAGEVHTIHASDAAMLSELFVRQTQTSPLIVIIEDIDVLPDVYHPQLLRYVGELAQTPSNIRLVMTGIHRTEDGVPWWERLGAYHLRIPALRERTEDITVLANHFLKRASAESGQDKKLDSRSYTALKHHNWPGNVTELKQTILTVAAGSEQEEVTEKEVQASLPAGQAVGEVSTDNHMTLQAYVEHYLTQYFAHHEGSSFPPGLYQRMLQIIEPSLLRATLEAVDNNQTKAAYVLGINRNTLHSKLKKYDILT